MTRSIVLLISILSMHAALQAVSEVPVWPIEGATFSGANNFASYVQPTASGKPESALFGCVRNDGRRFHEAGDLAPVGPRRNGEATDSLIAILDGRVAHINRIAGNSSYGRYVVIEHDQLTLPVYTLYAHLSRVDSELSVGDFVRQGTELGIMGRSAGGYSIPKSRSHLHLEIGLRLTHSFQRWYDQQGFSSENYHRNFNGMNLIGWDPIDYYEASSKGSAEFILEYFNQIPPSVVLHIRHEGEPDFLERYPQLVLEGCESEERKGWEVMMSAWGLPLSFRPLSEKDLRGVRDEGDISVLAVDRNRLSRFECRRIISFEKGKISLGTGGRQILELLFMQD